MVLVAKKMVYQVYISVAGNSFGPKKLSYDFSQDARRPHTLLRESKVTFSTSGESIVSNFKHVWTRRPLWWK